MSESTAVITSIHAAFDANSFPGERYLQGSFEGCEPYEEVEPFKDKRDWREIDAEFLDAHGGALCFFSEAGFRFYLPAYLIADINGQLAYADPLFHLTHGFTDFTVEIPKGERVFTIKSGKSALMNPRRYGALTHGDYARWRLSIFTREEASAVVAYLHWKREGGEAFDTERIDAALDQFWLPRAQSAPTSAQLAQHLADEQAYLETIRGDAS